MSSGRCGKDHPPKSSSLADSEPHFEPLTLQPLLRRVSLLPARSFLPCGHTSSGLSALPGWTPVAPSPGAFPDPRGRLDSYCFQNTEYLSRSISLPQGISQSGQGHSVVRRQGRSIPAPLTFWAGSFFLVEDALCMVGCLACAHTDIHTQQPGSVLRELWTGVFLAGRRVFSKPIS